MRRTIVGVTVLATVITAVGACTGSPAPRARSASAQASSTPVVSAATSAAPTSAAPSSRLSSAPSSSAPSRQHRTVTVLGSGDVLIHPPVWQQAHRDALADGRHGYDFYPMYKSIQPDVEKADLATCELESPLAPPQGPFRGWPTFSSPPQVLRALKRIGYDSCTTASNHTLDDGVAGVRRTLDELDAAGLKHTGSARSAAAAARPLIETMPNGVKVAQLAYAFGFNGIPLPAGKPWLANLTDIPKIIAAAKRAKQDGADIVVLSMHWGIEYHEEPTALQVRQAHELLHSKYIDLILGDHPHVVEPAQRIDGKWVIYSMGNQISRHADPVLESREGAMPEFTFTETRPGHFVVTTARVIPTLERLTPKLRLIDLPRALRQHGLSAANRLMYTGAEADIRTVLDAMGAAAHGLIVG